MYKILDNATADVAFIAEGNSLEEMFEDSAKAVSQIMVELETIEEKESIEFSIQGKNKEEMLFNFLQEIIIIKDSDMKIFKRFDVKTSGNKVTCKAYGDILNNKKQAHGVDVKAVTYHKFQVINQDGIWKCHVILDI